MSRAPAAGEESWLDRNRDSESPRRDWRDEDRPKPCASCGRLDEHLDEHERCVGCAADDAEVGL